MRKRISATPRPQHVNSYVDPNAVEDDSAGENGSQTRWRMRFGMRGLLTLMLISSVLFAAFGYLLHAVRGGSRVFQLAFILFTLVGPMVLLIVFSIAAWLIRLPFRYRHSPEDRLEEN